MCNNEPPLCLSKYFAFCPEEFVHFSELSLNSALTVKSEKAMSPPTGQHKGLQVKTFFFFPFLKSNLLEESNTERRVY